MSIENRCKACFSEWKDKNFRLIQVAEHSERDTHTNLTY